MAFGPEGESCEPQRSASSDALGGNAPALRPKCATTPQPWELTGKPRLFHLGTVTRRVDGAGLDGQRVLCFAYNLGTGRMTTRTPILRLRNADTYIRFTGGEAMMSSADCVTAQGHGLSRRRFVSLATATVGSMAFPSAVFSQSSRDLQVDGDGLIVHRNLDGGDTAQREGWYWFGEWLRGNDLHLPSAVDRKTMTVTKALDLLEPAKDGVFYRHPKLPPWNNPYDKKHGFSRDQMIPLVATMGVYGMEDRLRRLWNKLPQDRIGGTKHTFNGQLTTVLGVKAVYTGDIVGPMTINLFRRCWKENPLTASDHNGAGGEKELAMNVDLRIASSLTDRDNTGDDLNLIVMLLVGVLRFPSRTLQDAAQRYAKNRGVSFGSFLGAYRDKYGIDFSASPRQVLDRMEQGIKSGWKTDSSRVLGAIRWYHRAESGANPQLAELYAPIIKKYLE